MFTKIALLTLAARAYAAFSVASCDGGDYITTIAGSDGSPGIIANGPLFNTNTGNDLIASADDKLDIVFVNPMVVNAANNTWERSVSFFLGGTGVAVTSTAEFDSEYGDARAACKMAQAAPTLLSALVATGEATCQPTFTLSNTWETIRNASLGCDLTEDLTDPNYFIYTGNVWVKWQDSDGAAVDPFSRAAAFTSYPITVKFQKAINQTANEDTDNPDPYVSDSFRITSVTYDKGATNVAMAITYQISTNWPYIPMPNSASSALVDGEVAGDKTNPLTVPMAYSGSYNVGAFTSTTGCAVTTEVANAEPLGGVCTYTQTVTYTWAFAGKCDAGSATAFQMRFATCATASLNGATNEGCISNQLLTGAGGTVVGDFIVSPGIDLCKAPASQYTLTANGADALVATAATVDAGKSVEFTTTITSAGGKQMDRVSVWEVYATRGGNRWNMRLDNTATSFAPRVDFDSTATVAVDGITADVTLTYTPNIGSSSLTDYMIVLADREAILTYSNFVRLRVYWDSVNVASDGGNGINRRRLMYRDQVVSSVAGTQDFAQKADVRVRVPASAGANAASTGLSTAAIAGIATASIVLVASVGIVGALVYRKRRNLLVAETDSTKSLSKV
jgi:hypothetical protein